MTGNKYSFNLGGKEIAEGHCAMNGWLLLEIFLASVAKGITEQLLTGIWATFDLLDIQTEMLTTAIGFSNICVFSLQIISYQHTQS